MKTLENRSWLLLAALAAHVLLTNGYPGNRDLIPNGHFVPNPCIANHIWPGAGHKNMLGGGERNPFGLEFSNIRDWSILCSMDSDGDGRTNGEELGDPNCVWTQGQPPQENIGLSHPGICEPLDDTICIARNAWLVCTSDEFQCAALNETGVQNATLRFPHIQLPAQEITMLCHAFRLPADDDYHLVATEPYFNNSEVLHHMALFGCEDDSTLDFDATAPVPCTMLESSCTMRMTSWIVGFTGQCLNENIGYPFGSSGIKAAVIQIHWDNPLQIADYWDSSGLTIHYTTKKRPYEAQNLVLGQTSMVIPPSTSSTNVISICSSECTNSFLTEPIYVVSGFNHMHSLGRSSMIQQFRDGKLIRTINDEPEYSYDHPTQFNYDPPLDVMAGDQLILTCDFDSMSRSTPTTFSAAPSGEMCFAYLTYFPNVTRSSNTFNCLDWKDLDMCRMMNADVFQPVINGCEWNDFKDTSHPDTENMIAKVMGVCVFDMCTVECMRAIEEVGSYACMKGTMGEYMMANLYGQPGGPEFLKMLTTCDNGISGGASPRTSPWRFGLALFVFVTMMVSFRK